MYTRFSYEAIDILWPLSSNFNNLILDINEVKVLYGWSSGSFCACCEAAASIYNTFSILSM